MDSEPDTRNDSRKKYLNLLKYVENSLAYNHEKFKNMVTYFNTKDLVSFGNYMMSEERKKRFKNTQEHLIGQGLSPLPWEEAILEVYDADIANWKESIGKT